MRWSRLTGIFALLLLFGARHSSAADRPQPPPLFESMGNSIAAANGVPVFGAIVPDSDFSPDPSRTPVWVKAGVEIAFLGQSRDRSVIIGFGGPLFRLRNTIFEADAGDLILDFAANPDTTI